MSDHTETDLKTTSDNAAFYALVCLTPIFVIVVTFGWARILKPVIPLDAPFVFFISYPAAIFLAVVAVVLAKVIAAESIQLTHEKGPRVSLSTCLSRCWAYVLVLVIISSLGTARTIFTITQASDVLSGELSQTSAELRALEIGVDSVLQTPEYDVLAAEYKIKRAKIGVLVTQFDNEMQRVYEVELSKMSDDRARVDTLWLQFEGEMNNPLGCGFGPETERRFRELQAALPGLQKLAGSSAQCDKIPATLSQYKIAVASLKDIVFSPSKYNCAISPSALQRWADLQTELPELKPLDPAGIPCNKMADVIKNYAAAAESLIAKIDVPVSQTPVTVIEFKNRAKTAIDAEIKTIETMIVNSAKITPADALPVLRKSWEVYQAVLSEGEIIAHGKFTNLARDIKREEVANIENLSNILRILASRWDNFMTYLTLLGAVLLDLILIAFFRRHLSSLDTQAKYGFYDGYVSSRKIFRR